MSDEQSDIQAAIDAGLASALPQPLDPAVAPVYSLTVPRGGNHHTIDMTPYIRAETRGPKRPLGVYHPSTLKAFIDVAKRYADPDETTIWVDDKAAFICAVFNDNDAANAQPGWRDHRAELQLRFTDEWKHWTSRDNQMQGQVPFAEFIEDGLTEIADPPAATMLELAQTFQAKSDVNFRSAVRIKDGTVQAQYDEVVDASAGAGQMAIPSEFTLAISPFIGEDPYRLTARLRYRVKEGNLSMGYKLDHPERIIRDAIEGVAEALRAEFPVVFIGMAGASR